MFEDFEEVIDFVYFVSVSMIFFFLLKFVFIVVLIVVLELWNWIDVSDFVTELSTSDNSRYRITCFSLMDQRCGCKCSSFKTLLFLPMLEYATFLIFLLMLFHSVFTPRSSSISQGCSSIKAAWCWWCYYPEWALWNLGTYIIVPCKWFCTSTLGFLLSKMFLMYGDDYLWIQVWLHISWVNSYSLHAWRSPLQEMGLQLLQDITLYFLGDGY